MREAFNRLTKDERHILSEVSVNPIFKQITQLSLNQARGDILMLDPDDKLFNAKYRALQMQIDFIEDIISMNNQLFNQFYKSQQGQDVKE